MPPLSPSDAPGTTPVTETLVVACDNVLIPTLSLPHIPVETLALPSSRESTIALLRWDSLALSPRSDISAVR